MRQVMVLVAVFTAIALSGCAHGASQNDLSDFKRFVDKRDACEHFGGEVSDPPDPECMKEVAEQIQIYCTGTDAKLAVLKAKYANNAEVMSKLNRYEEKIERIRR